MTIDFSLDSNDFLTFQLYSASRSPSIRKKRKRNKITVPLFYGIIAVFFLSNGSPVTGIAFVCFGLLWIFFYPRWETQHYVKHYKKFIKERYNESEGVSATVEFHEDYILAKDSAAESKIQNSEIKEIVELPSNIFIYIKGGSAFNIPKRKIQELDALKTLLKNLAARLNVKYISEEKWEWK